MGVVIGSENFLDLVEEFKGNSLAVLSVWTLYLLEHSELGCDHINTVLVMLIDWSVIIDLAGFLILNDIVLGLEFLEFIGDLKL